MSATLSTLRFRREPKAGGGSWRQGARGFLAALLRRFEPAPPLFCAFPINNGERAMSNTNLLSKILFLQLMKSSGEKSRIFLLLSE